MKYEIGLMLAVGEDPFANIEKVRSLGVGIVHLGCPPAAYLARDKRALLRDELNAGGIIVTTVFVGFPEECYSDIAAVKRTVGFADPRTRDERMRTAFAVADFARFLGVSRVASHIGFVPDDRRSDAYAALVEAVGAIADHCKENGQVFALETGQETAPALLEFIHNAGRENLRVNFDPANMIMYGAGDPIAALDILAPYVDGVHVKDGKGPRTAGELGPETPLGQGDVGIERFIRKLEEIAYSGPLVVEREIAGPGQTAEARAALEYLKTLF